MAIAPSAINATFFRDATLPSITGDFTVMGWFSRTSGTPGGLGLFQLYDGSFNNNLLLDVETHLGVRPLHLGGYDGSTFFDAYGIDDLTSGLEVGTWYHAAWVCTGGQNHTIYLTSEDHTFNLVVEITATFNPLISPLGEIDVYCSQHSAITNFKFFTSALNTSQIAAERDSYALSNPGTCYAALNLSGASDTADSSGNGHDFTLTDVIESVAGPAILGGGGVIPNAPTNLTVDTSAYEQAVLTWTDNSTNEDGFHIQRSSDGVVWIPIFTTVANVTTFTDLTVEPDASYLYRVNAFNLTGASSWTVSDPVLTRVDFAVRVPSDPGAFFTVPNTIQAQALYALSDSPGAPIPAPGGANFTVLTWVRPDNAGTATIATFIRHRAWPWTFQDPSTNASGTAPNPAPSGSFWEYGYGNPLFSYLWMGLRQGKLVFEVYDGRVPAYNWPHAQIAQGCSLAFVDSFTCDTATGQDTQYHGFFESCIAGTVNGAHGEIVNCPALEAGIQADQLAYAGAFFLNYSQGLPSPANVPAVMSMCTCVGAFSLVLDAIQHAYVVSQPQGAGNMIQDLVTVPNVVDPNSFQQKVTVLGPSLPPGKWSRVAFRWATTYQPNSGRMASSALEIWVGCQKVASVPWNGALAGANGVQKFFLPYQLPGGANIDTPGSLANQSFFVGGCPNDTYIGGDVRTAIQLTDFRYYSKDDNFNFTTGGISETDLAAACACAAGPQPLLWWKLRDGSDLANVGYGTTGEHIDGTATPVGFTPVQGAINPTNPCNVLQNQPAPPPPPAHFRPAAIITSPAVPGTGCPTDDQPF